MHAYIDTDVELREVYSKDTMWELFENFLPDISTVSIVHTVHTIYLTYTPQVKNRYADPVLKTYVFETILKTITMFFTSNFFESYITAERLQVCVSLTCYCVYNAFKILGVNSSLYVYFVILCSAMKKFLYCYCDTCTTYHQHLLELKGMS